MLPSLESFPVLVLYSVQVVMSVAYHKFAAKEWLVKCVAAWEQILGGRV